MTAPPAPDSGLTPSGDPPPDGRQRRPSPAWTRAAGLIADAATVTRDVVRHLWDEARDRDGAHWPPTWLIYTVATLAAGILLLVLVPLLRGILAFVGRLLLGGGQWLQDLTFTDVVTRPVHRYLLQHAAGLPVSGPTLWWTWCAATATLFLLALLGSAGARWGWAAHGVATTAMVAAGTAPTSRWTAAGVAVLWWSLLSVPAYRRRALRIRLKGRWPGPPPPPRPPRRGEPDTAAPAPAADSAPRDDAETAAAVYERMLRRQLLAERLHGVTAVTWTATTRDGGHGFTAVEAHTGRLVTGRAMTVDAAPLLLAALSTPPAALPLVHWQAPPPPPLQMLRTRNRHAPDLPTSLQAFIRDSGDELAAVRRAVLALRADWDVNRLDEQITARAAHLNRSHPITVNEPLMPEAKSLDDRPGSLRLYAWVDPVTVVGGNAAHWNDFSNHRPDTVRLIIEAMLSTETIEATLEEILSEGNGLHLTRTPGPAGPLHQVGLNGTHRAHALRMLGIPSVAAEVFVPSLPLRLTARDVGYYQRPSPIGQIWRALIDRDLLVGDVRDTALGPVLEPHHIAAPWLLHRPDSAASISAAYNRIYPGALEKLGIPATAMTTGQNWLRWLRV